MVGQNFEVIYSSQMSKLFFQGFPGYGFFVPA